MSDYRNLETDRLEIVLVAAGVLVLVSVLGILLLLGIGLRAPSPNQDAENCQRFTAWGGTLNGQQRRATEPIEAYHDEAEPKTFIGSFRRKSQILADELKQELISLKHGLTMTGALPAERHLTELGVVNKLRGLSFDCRISPPRRESDPEVAGEPGSDYVVSPITPVSATGREEETNTALQRRSRLGKDAWDCDLEARDADDS